MRIGADHFYKSRLSRFWAEDRAPAPPISPSPLSPPFPAQFPPPYPEQLPVTPPAPPHPSPEQLPVMGTSQALMCSLCHSSRTLSRVLMCSMYALSATEGRYLGQKLDRNMARRYPHRLISDGKRNSSELCSAHKAPRTLSTGSYCISHPHHIW